MGLYDLIHQNLGFLFYTILKRGTWGQFGIFVLICLSVSIIGILLHEIGHYLAGRRFGWKGRLLILPAFTDRGFRKERGLLGFLSAMAVDFPEQVLRHASAFQIRVTAAAGPLAELTYLTFIIAGELMLTAALSAESCKTYGIAMFVIAPLYVASVQFVCSILMNVVPLRRLGNDGHRFLTGRI